MKRHNFGSSHSDATINSASTTKSATGCASARYSSVPTNKSSPNDAAQFDIGSGEVLIARRAPALVKWLPAASVPPRIAEASMHAGGESPKTLAARTAPAGMRIKVCTTSHTESKPGILSAKNSAATMNPEAQRTSGCDSTRRCSGISNHPAKPTAPTTNRTA